MTIGELQKLLHKLVSSKGPVDQSSPVAAMLGPLGLHEISGYVGINNGKVEGIALVVGTYPKQENADKPQPKIQPASLADIRKMMPPKDGGAT